MAAPGRWANGRDVVDFAKRVVKKLALRLDEQPSTTKRDFSSKSGKDMTRWRVVDDRGNSLGLGTVLAQRPDGWCLFRSLAEAARRDKAQRLSIISNWPQVREAIETWIVEHKDQDFGTVILNTEATPAVRLTL